MKRACLLGFCLLLSFVPLRSEELPAGAKDLTWHDSARNRDVPVRIYMPTTGAAPFPVIIFSHGLGGSRENYTYLGKYWSGHGYVSVHVQHAGSDTAAIRSSSLMGALRNPDNMVNRPKDISFTIDMLTKLNSTPEWKGKFDLDRVGVAGHSYGAYTTMAIAGEKFPDTMARMQGLPDPRVKAAIAMSTPSPSRMGEKKVSYGSVHIPVMHMTGTDDTIQILGQDDVKDRRIPYDLSPGPDTYLIIYEGGDHMVFSGRPRTWRGKGGGENDELFQKLTCEASTAFWNAYLKGDASAKEWLGKGGLAAALGKNGTLEKK